MAKLILITGATDGIGRATATELARRGHHIIIHGRNEQKARAVVAAIKTATGNNQVEYLIADLLDFRAIRQMVSEFGRLYDHLDVLINNAGAVLDDEQRENSAGIEATMALNVLAPLLLTQLLLPKLEAATAARVINMSSGTYRIARPDLSDLNLVHVHSGQTRYGISKLFVIWNTQHLARLLALRGVTNVTVNASHPGSVATNFGHDSKNGFWVDAVYKVAIWLAHVLPIDASPEHGAATNIYLADSPAIAQVTGKFFDNHQRQITPKMRTWSMASEQEVWDYCMAQIQPYLQLDEN